MSSPKAPEAPDYAKANREGIIADIETLPMRKQIEAAARLGQKVTVDIPDVGQRTYDFTGYSDADLTKAQMAQDRETAFANAKTQLELQDLYGDDFIEKSRKQLQMSDPEGFAAREQLAKTLMTDFAKGGELSDDVRREVEQSTRAGQSARGNYLGQANVTAEAMQTAEASERLKQQRLTNIAAFINGTTPTAQFSQVTGAQAGAAGWMPQQMVQGIGQNANAGAQAAQFATSVYGTKAQIYNTQSQAATAQMQMMTELAGSAMGMAGSIM